MDINKDVKIEDKKSNLLMESRKKLSLTGVIEVLSFDEEKITLNTVLGGLVIKGKKLKMHKLDVQNGDVIIIGNISSCIYSDVDAKKSNEGFFRRLFK